MKHVWICSIALLAGWLSSGTLMGQEAASPADGMAFRPVWHFRPMGKDIGSCAENGGLLVISMKDGDLIALKGATGDVVWTRNVGASLDYALDFTADPAHDWLLVSSRESLIALDRKTGELQWIRYFPHGLAGVTVVGDRICGASYDGRAYGVNLADGKIVWSSDFLEDAPADPPGFSGESARFGEHPARPRRASHHGHAFCFSVFDQCRALAFHVQTGARLAAYPTRGWMFMQPVITDKHVFVGSQDEHMYCFDKQTGAVVWKHATGSRVEATCTLDDRHVYWGSCDANLYCLNRETGDVVWKFTTDKYPKRNSGPIYEAAVLDGENVILPAMEGQVYVLNAANGHLLSQFRPAPSSEIDGAEWDGTRLFVQTRRGSKEAGEEGVFALLRR